MIRTYSSIHLVYRSLFLVCSRVFFNLPLCLFSSLSLSLVFFFSVFLFSSLLLCLSSLYLSLSLSPVVEVCLAKASADIAFLEGEDWDDALEMYQNAATHMVCVRQCVAFSLSLGVVLLFFVRPRIYALLFDHHPNEGNTHLYRATQH
jgi:hypothetical protein